MQRIINWLFLGRPRLDKVLKQFTVTMTELDRLIEASDEEVKQANADQELRRKQYQEETARITASFLEDDNAIYERKQASQAEGEKAAKVRSRVASLIGEEDQ